MPKSTNIRLSVHPDLDVQRREHAEILLLRDPRVEEVSEGDIDYYVIDAVQLAQYPKIKNNIRWIALSLGDLYQGKIGLRRKDFKYRNYLRENGVKIIYLECETEPIDSAVVDNQLISRKMRTYPDPDSMAVLTLPMGYISGSKINIHYPDNDVSALFINHLESNPKEYEYDYCWIGTDTAEDRIEAIDLLEKKNGNGFIARSQISLETDKDKRAEIVHADNKKIPYDDFLTISRRSKINISCNGMGMWCYKDAEMLSRNCFVLRQWHRNLDKNPLSPKDGEHWAVFRTEEIGDKIDYYLSHEKEREEINDAGHEYFKRGIMGGWAKHYVDALIAYKESNSFEAFGKLRR